MKDVIIDYLEAMNLRVSHSYIEKQLLSHPDYPSLLSVSDLFSRLGVPTHIGKISEKHISKIELPFLIHQESSRYGFLLIENKDDLSKNEFDFTNWEGIVLKAEPIDKIKDNVHNSEFAKEQLVKKVTLALIISLIVLVCFPLLQSFSWSNSVLLSTSILGALVGYILFAKELGTTFSPVESFCNTSTRVNCDKILNSKGAKILSFFSLSEAVISFFAFQLLVCGIVLPFLELDEPYLWVLIFGSALSIPIVLYSIYYQAIIAKTWCKLCMVVNAILVIQAFFFGYLITVGALEIQEIELLPFMYSIFLFLIFASSVILVKEKSGQANKAANAEIAGNRVKYNPEVFAHLLFQGQKVNYTIQGKEILIGDRNAPLNLLMVANLNCYPCKLGFENVLKLIDQYPIQINATFRFLPSGSTVHDIPASTFLIQYWEQYICGTNKESENTRKLIKDWYEEMSVEKFEKIYSNKLSIDEAKESKLAISHYEWIKKYGIVRTPIYFLNGYEYPSNYVIKDLESLIFGITPLVEARNNVSKKKKELVL